MSAAKPDATASAAIPSTDIVVWQAPVVEAAIFGTGDLPEVEDDDAALVAFAQQLAQATDIEGVLRAFEMTPRDDVLDLPLEVTNVRWRSSQLDGKARCYMIVNASRLDDGSEVVFATGGQLVMLAVLRILTTSGLPFRCKFAEGQASRKGRSPVLRLARV